VRAIAIIAGIDIEAVDLEAVDLAEQARVLAGAAPDVEQRPAVRPRPADQVGDLSASAE